MIALQCARDFFLCGRVASSPVSVQVNAADAHIVQRCLHVPGFPQCIARLLRAEVEITCTFSVSNKYHFHSSLELSAAVVTRMAPWAIETRVAGATKVVLTSLVGQRTRRCYERFARSVFRLVSFRLWRSTSTKCQRASVLVVECRCTRQIQCEMLARSVTRRRVGFLERPPSSSR